MGDKDCGDLPGDENEFEDLLALESGNALPGDNGDGDGDHDFLDYGGDEFEEFQTEELPETEEAVPVFFNNYWSNDWADDDDELREPFSVELARERAKIAKLAEETKAALMAAEAMETAAGAASAAADASAADAPAASSEPSVSEETSWNTTPDQK